MDIDEAKGNTQADQAARPMAISTVNPSIQASIISIGNSVRMTPPQRLLLSLYPLFAIASFQVQMASAPNWGLTLSSTVPREIGDASSQVEELTIDIGKLLMTCLLLYCLGLWYPKGARTVFWIYQSSWPDRYVKPELITGRPSSFLIVKHDHNRNCRCIWRGNWSEASNKNNLNLPEVTGGLLEEMSVEKAGMVI